MLPPFSSELRSVAGIFAPVAILFAGIFIAAIWPIVKYWLTGKGRKPTPPQPIIWILTSFFLILGVFSQTIASWPVPDHPPIPMAVSMSQDDSTFVYDETIPDDTQVLPGQSFVKTWRLYNRGTSNWNNYEARRFAQLSTGTFGPTGIRVDDTLAKHDVTITKEMVAPATPGCYRAVYQMFNGLEPFGEMFWVQIVVISPQVRDYGVFINDLNARDYTLFNPGELFRKGWRLNNCGENTWVNYKAVRVSGSLQGPESIPVPVTSGNQSVDIWADFMAPLIQTPGSSAVYQLEDANGHPVGNVTFDVIIKTEPAA